MKSKRVIITGIAVLGALTVSIIFGMSGGGSQQSAKQLVGQRNGLMLQKGALSPGRLEHGANKIGKNREAGGELNGPAQEAYDNRAYPATRVAYAQSIGTERAYSRIAAKSKTAQKVIESNGWKSVGPDTLDVSLFGTQTYGAPTQWSGRVTALASWCPKGKDCTVYVAAAGGGVWKSTNPLAAVPTWKQITDNWLATTSIGTITIDPNDSTGKTIYVGTGEPNGSSDSEAGVGVYKSTDGGTSWTLLGGSVAAAKDRGVATIAVDPTDPNHLLMGTDVARHGASSHNGGRFTPPGAPTIGLWESHNAGGTWNLIFNQPQDVVNPASSNGGDFFAGGVTKIQFDPGNPSVYYFSMTGYGVYRSVVDGFEQIFADTESPFLVDCCARNDLVVRFEFAAVTTGQKIPGSKAKCTRMYVGAGWNGDPVDEGPHGASRLYRTDCLQTADADALIADDNAGWLSLSSPNPADPGYGSYYFCQNGQCQYDMFVVSPPGKPDTVYLGGSMHYEELPLYGGAPDISNGRGVIRSTDGGASWTDMTGDGTPTTGEFGFTPFESMHPDQHAMVFDQSNPNVWWEGSDGGVIRSDGKYKNNKKDCNAFWRSYDTAQDFANCQQLLSSIPKKLTTVNAGLNTLQFESLSVDPNNPLGNVFGGTQDNGTLAYDGSNSWFLGITGDGGDSTINAADGTIVTHTYTGTETDTNFHGSNPETWVWTADQMFLSGETASFYAPMIADDAHPGTIFAGMDHIWRTTDNGGDQTFLEAHCNTTGVFGTSDGLFTGACGDWATTGDVELNSSDYGPDKGADSSTSNYLAQIAPAADSSTMWAATRRGRVFISFNRDASDPADVEYFRIDVPDSTPSADYGPTRFPSGIAVDPSNPYHAFISYAGYNAYAASAGTVQGHIFEVWVNPASCSAGFCTDVTWNNIDLDIGDQPVTQIAFDSDTQDLYVGTDYGVYRTSFNFDSELYDGTWLLASFGLPPVAVYGLTLRDIPDSGGKRILYAATHGRGAWRLTLPPAE